MRSPGEDGAGRAAGRRHGSSGRNAGPRHPGSGPAGQDGAHGHDDPSLFVPGYRASQDRPDVPSRDSGQFSWRGLTGVAVGKGPVRGYPPAPGQPPLLYPPGQFAAWNRTARLATQPDGLGSAWGEADDAGLPFSDDTAYAGAGYSALAVSDPAADVTSTQTWPTVDGGSERSEPATARSGPASSVQPEPIGTARRAATGTATQDSAAPAPTAPPDTGPGRPRGPGTGGHRSGARGGRGKTRSRRRRGILLALVGLGAAIAIGGGVYSYVHYIRDKAGQSAASSLRHNSASHQATSPPPSPSSSKSPWGHIASRSTDKTPLTLAQLFPARFTAGGTSYGRTIRRRSSNCQGAVIGTQLQNAVHGPGCSQVLRASYLSAKAKLMGTIGVLNLKTFASAERAGRAAGRKEFIAQLAAPRGPTSRLTSGTGIEEADVKGHYLILVWGEFTSLRPPRTHARRLALERFLTDLISKTANVSLTARMVNGRP